MAPAGSGGTHHRHAGNVLRGHGDHEQGQGDAGHGGPRQGRGHPLRYRQLQVHLLCVQQATAGGDRDTDQQGGDDGVAREQAAPGQPGGEHRQCQHQLGVYGHEHVQAEAQQHAGQHARGPRHRHPLHQPGEQAREARQHAQHGGEQEGAGRFRERSAAGTHHQHGRTRGRPCGH
ncbi:hypothetical protein G6F24_015753 [Rhizopus arrhizus]|nr:hypothetical protein G6F24_015753 [Rhizopus arrhizus]